MPYGAGFASKVTEHVGLPQLEFGGFVAEHWPLHWMVPVLVCPHALAAEVHALPYPAGFGGVVAEQTPLQLYVPVVVWPQEFADEEQDCPELAVQAGFTGSGGPQGPLPGTVETGPA